MRSESKVVGSNTAERCHKCGKPVNAFDKRCSKALAYQNPHCDECMAEEYDMNIQDFLNHMHGIFAVRPCLGL